MAYVIRVEEGREAGGGEGYQGAGKERLGLWAEGAGTKKNSVRVWSKAGIGSGEGRSGDSQADRVVQSGVGGEGRAC